MLFYYSFLMQFPEKDRRKGENPVQPPMPLTELSQKAPVIHAGDEWHLLEVLMN